MVQKNALNINQYSENNCKHLLGANSVPRTWYELHNLKPMFYEADLTSFSFSFSPPSSSSSSFLLKCWGSNPGHFARQSALPLTYIPSLCVRFDDYFCFTNEIIEAYGGKITCMKSCNK
jgi:hypothetical protein